MLHQVRYLVMFRFLFPFPILGESLARQQPLHVHLDYLIAQQAFIMMSLTPWLIFAGLQQESRLNLPTIRSILIDYRYPNCSGRNFKTKAICIDTICLYTYVITCGSCNTPCSYQNCWGRIKAYWKVYCGASTTIRPCISPLAQALPNTTYPILSTVELAAKSSKYDGLFVVTITDAKVVLPGDLNAVAATLKMVFMATGNEVTPQAV